MHVVDLVKHQIDDDRKFDEVEEEADVLYQIGDQQWHQGYFQKGLNEIRENKAQKELPILGADAIVEPLAVVVKVRDAFVAFATVFGIRADIRSTYLAIIFEKLIRILLSFEHIRQEFI